MKKIQAFLAALLLVATSISSISSSAFTELEDLPDDVSIYDNWIYAPAFSGYGVDLLGVVDTSVTSITVPAEIDDLPVVGIPYYLMNTNNIDRGLANCLNLTEILVDEESEYFESIDGILFSKDLGTIYVYPRNRETEVYTVPDGTHEIASKILFDRCRNLKEIILPETLFQSIYPIVIDGCRSLEKITSQGALNNTNIINCPSLKEIDLKTTQNFTTLGNVKFQKLDNLEMLMIPEKCYISRNFTVQDCPKLNQLALSNHMTADAEISVLNCNSLESLDFSNIQSDEPTEYSQVTKLNIADCAELKEIQLPDVKCYSIKNCPKLTSLSFDTDTRIDSIELQRKNSHLRDLYFYSTDSWLSKLKISEAVLDRVPGWEYEIDYRYFASMRVTVHCRKEDTNTQNLCEKYNIPYVFIEDEILPGDVGNDGELDILDVVMLNRVVVGVDRANPSKVLAGDLNGNGKLELTDSMAILRKLVGLDA